MQQPEKLRAWYRSYDEVLGSFVVDGVLVNGKLQGLDGYVEGRQSVVDAFPDYRRDLRHLLVEPPWVAAHFVDTGTHLGPFRESAPTGRAVATQEVAMYRVVGERIVEVWVTADNAALIGPAD